MPRLQLLAAVFAGGALGTLLRAALATWFPHEIGEWPVATLVANLVAAFAIGWVGAWIARAGADTEGGDRARDGDDVGGVDPRVRPFLVTGICGGLSTFATVQVELVLLLDAGDWGVAAGYLAVTLVGGAFAVVAGRALGGGGSTPAASPTGEGGSST